MKRALLILMLALCLPLLCACGDGMEIEEHAFALSMAIDRTELGQIRVSLQVLSGSQGAGDGGAQEKKSEDGGEDEPALVQDGYLLVSAEGVDYPHAMALMAATLPRKLSLSHLREVVVSEEIARTEDFYPLLLQIQSSYEAEENAFLVVSREEARSLIAAQRPYIGSRLSRYLELLFEYYSDLGYIPQSRLGDVLRAMTARVGDPAVIYAAVHDPDAPADYAPDDALNSLPGNLPRKSASELEFLGAAVFSGKRMVGELTGRQVQLLRVLTGSFTQCTYFLGGEPYTLRQTKKSRLGLRFDGGQATLTARVYLTAEHELPASKGEDALRVELEQELRALLSRLQAFGSDCAGFGRYAIRRCATVGAWEQSGWPQAYAAAPAQIEVRLLVRAGN